MIQIDFHVFGVVVAALLGFIALLTIAAKYHWDLFIGPRFHREMVPIKTDLSIISRLLREKYREEWEKTAKDVNEEQRFIPFR